MQRVAQPPIQPSQRPAERAEFWPGFILSIIGLLVLLAGTQHLTGVDTTDGGTARETQLMKAFASGGLEMVEAAPLPDPGAFADPAQAAAAIEQWERASARSTGPKFRVNTGAANPCPT